MTHAAEIFRGFRDELYLSQSELAARIGVSKTTIQTWESVDRYKQPSRKNLQKYATLLKRSVEEVVRAIDDHEVNNSTATPTVSPAESGSDSAWVQLGAGDLAVLRQLQNRIGGTNAEVVGRALSLAVLASAFVADSVRPQKAEPRRAGMAPPEVTTLRGDGKISGRGARRTDTTAPTR